MTIRNRRFLGLMVACLAGAALGCARSSVALNPALSEEGERKPVARPGLAAEPAKVEKPAPAPEGRFAFPADRSGALLGALLIPGAETSSGIRVTPGPQTLPPPSAVARPSVPLPDNQSVLPRRSVEAAAPAVRPHMLAEGLPLSSYHADPRPPVSLDLPAGAPVRLTSRDVNRPVSLPILAQPGVDRVPLDDPTVEDSLRAVLAATPPVRTTPAPFGRQQLPDPFENAQTVKLKTLPPEETSPSSGAPQPPK
jgi:hypothetical protein